jgi:hypothetical protein
LERVGQNKDRFKQVRAALEKAADLKRQGKNADAERIWTGIEQLYRNDPGAAELLQEVAKARQK